MLRGHQHLKWSPTSQTCHQHIWSPTSVTNIDVPVHNNHIWTNIYLPVGSEIWLSPKYGNATNWHCWAQYVATLVSENSIIWIRGIFEMAKKMIEGGVVTCIGSNSNWNSTEFLLIFSSKWPSLVKTLRWLILLARKLWDGSKFEPLSPRIHFLFEFWAILEFRAKKGSHLKVLTRDGHFQLKIKRNWSVRILSRLKVTGTWQHLLRWLFEPSQGPPRMYSLYCIAYTI